MNAESGVRHDVYIENDSSGFSVVPSSAVADIIADARRNDRRFVTEHRAVRLILNGDDSFPARLVVGGQLTETENAEWIARATWRLDIPCGNVLLCGGFDPRVLKDWVDDAGFFTDCVHAIPVSAGDYLVDVYTHRPTASGRLIEDSWPTPVGAWFRRDYPGEAYPRWLVDELELLPDLDPGHESEWDDPGAAIRAGRLAVDESLANVIGYLVHLQPFSLDAKLSTLPDDGWFEPETGARVPARCPRGLSTTAHPPS